MEKGQVTLVQFLKESVRAVENGFGNIDGKIHIVVGNEACNLDSAVSGTRVHFSYSLTLILISNSSALVYAFHLFQANSDSGKLILPFLNITEAEFPLKTEVAFAFREQGIEQALLLFTDRIDPVRLHNLGKLTLTLVDHHIPVGKFQDLTDAVVQVIDHHPITDSVPASKYLQKINYEIKVVGSCATLIAAEIQKHPELTSLNELTALLLYETIIFDTVNFSPTAGKTTPLDLEMAEKLSGLVPTILTRDEIYSRLIAAKSNILRLTVEQALRKDMKIVGKAGIKLAVCSLPQLCSTYFRSNAILEEVSTFCQAGYFCGVIILGIALQNDGQRDMLIFAADSQLSNKIISALSNNSEVKLDLQRDAVFHPRDTRFSYFKQGNKTASRKQILPLLEQITQNSAKEVGQTRNDMSTFSTTTLPGADLSANPVIDKTMDKVDDVAIPIPIATTPRSPLVPHRQLADLKMEIEKEATTANTVYPDAIGENRTGDFLGNSLKSGNDENSFSGFAGGKESDQKVVKHFFSDLTENDVGPNRDTVDGIDPDRQTETSKDSTELKSELHSQVSGSIKRNSENAVEKPTIAIIEKPKDLLTEAMVTLQYDVDSTRNVVSQSVLENKTIVSPVDFACQTPIGSSTLSANKPLELSVQNKGNDPPEWRTLISPKEFVKGMLSSPESSTSAESKIVSSNQIGHDQTDGNANGIERLGKTLERNSGEDRHFDQIRSNLPSELYNGPLTPLLEDTSTAQSSKKENVNGQTFVQEIQKREDSNPGKASSKKLKQMNVPGNGTLQNQQALQIETKLIQERDEQIYGSGDQVDGKEPDCQFDAEKACMIIAIRQSHNMYPKIDCSNHTTHSAWGSSRHVDEVDGPRPTLAAASQENQRSNDLQSPLGQNAPQEAVIKDHKDIDFEMPGLELRITAPTEAACNLLENSQQSLTLTVSDKPPESQVYSTGAVSSSASNPAFLPTCPPSRVGPVETDWASYRRNSGSAPALSALEKSFQLPVSISSQGTEDILKSSDSDQLLHRSVAKSAKLLGESPRLESQKKAVDQVDGIIDNNKTIKRINHGSSPEIIDLMKSTQAPSMTLADRPPTPIPERSFPTFINASLGSSNYNLSSSETLSPSLKDSSDGERFSTQPDIISSLPEHAREKAVSDYEEVTSTNISLAVVSGSPNTTPINTDLIITNGQKLAESHPYDATTNFSKMCAENSGKMGNDTVDGLTTNDPTLAIPESTDHVPSRDLIFPDGPADNISTESDHNKISIPKNDAVEKKVEGAESQEKSSEPAAELTAKLQTDTVSEQLKSAFKDESNSSEDASKTSIPGVIFATISVHSKRIYHSIIGGDKKSEDQVDGLLPDSGEDDAKKSSKESLITQSIADERKTIQLQQEMQHDSGSVAPGGEPISLTDLTSKTEKSVADIKSVPHENGEADKLKPVVVDIKQVSSEIIGPKTSIIHPVSVSPDYIPSNLHSSPTDPSQANLLIKAPKQSNPSATSVDDMRRELFQQSRARGIAQIEKAGADVVDSDRNFDVSSNQNRRLPQYRMLSSDDAEKSTSGKSKTERLEMFKIPSLSRGMMSDSADSEDRRESLSYQASCEDSEDTGADQISPPVLESDALISGKISHERTVDKEKVDEKTGCEVSGVNGGQGEIWALDMNVIKEYKKVVQLIDSQSENQTIIVAFYACYLPHRSTEKYEFIMQNIFRYLTSILDSVSEKPYKFLFFNGGIAAGCHSSSSWLIQCCKMINRQMSKNLEEVLIVHPNFLLKAQLHTFGRAIFNASFYKRIRYVNNLVELGEIFADEESVLEQLDIPAAIENYDQVIFEKNASRTSTSDRRKSAPLCG